MPEPKNVLAMGTWTVTGGMFSTNSYSTVQGVDKLIPMSDHLSGGSTTSIQEVYVPMDDLTDPTPSKTFAHLNATTVLSKGLAAKGIYPTVDPLDSTSTMLQPQIIGEEQYETTQRVTQTLQCYKALQDIIIIFGLDELSEEDRLTVARV
ncbi:hypothetical protein Golax_010311 [Gossypium laxum]|uniref:H(+)-transporting two-sector ATPase n=1 Tax=Gossypium laxum TaxID=34288 RepID=A0A7J8ZHK0_9ROSI|nr:hypothetical protein [Gossypium laxum]